MSSTPNNHPDQGPRPGSDKNGRELVKNLQAIEADSFEEILAINEKYEWCYSVFLRLKEVDANLAPKEKDSLRLEQTLASIPDRSWDGSKHRRGEIKAELELLQSEIPYLRKQKHNLTIRIEHAEALYAFHSRTEGTGGTLLDYCGKLVAETQKLV
ncbi:hypothetical protein JCM5350_000942 [Sporobolomyces pararoseus]